MTRTKLVAVNEAGLRIGADHPRARITQEQVDEMCDLHEDEGVTAAELSRRYGLCYTHVRKILTDQIWAQTPAGWKRVKVKE